MARPARARPTVALRLDHVDTPDAILVLPARVQDVGGRIRTFSTVRDIEGEPPMVEVELEVEGADEEALVGALGSLDIVRDLRVTRALDTVFGKRIIVVGGGAQIAQVALGAVSEADRHNLRGERISVDTIPLVGEENLAAAVRAVADLPRARCLVLAGSLMVAALLAAFGFLIVNGVSARALGVNDVGSDPAAFSGTIRITGIVAGVSKEDPSIIGMMDRKELQCTTPNCNKLYIPFKAAGYTANRGDEVVVQGRFVAMGEGYLFMADNVKVVKTHRIGG